MLRTTFPMETSTLLCVAIGLLALMMIPNVVRIAKKSKSLQLWNAEAHHDRAGQRELNWYGRVDSQTLRTIRSSGHSASDQT
jgi:hypothetical protein